MFLQCCLSVATSSCEPRKDEKIMIDRPNKINHCQEKGIFGQSVSEECVPCGRVIPSGFGPVHREFILSEQYVTKDKNNKTLGRK